MIKTQNVSGRRPRIAFAHIPGEGWSAGTYYLKNLFFALRSLPADIQPELVLLVQNNTAPEDYNELAPFVDEVLKRPIIVRKTFFAELIVNVGKKIGFITKKENQMSALLKRHGVDIHFTLRTPPPGFRLPFLSWIPDFQHLHYPEFFSDQEIINRDTAFECSARTATRVILSSNSALTDFEKFAPRATDKARVLSFVAQIPDDIYEGNPEVICQKYNIPERFILLPNQFWKHKNHETVISALQIALKKEPGLTIVCTGNTNETRDLLYFSKLLCFISSVGVRERMVLLGLVPRHDLFLLMRQSIIVLQPSLFEGWNTTVEEVKSLGKGVIVSDIPVHREQNAPGAVYFNPTDAQSLASTLLDVFATGSPGPDSKLEKAATESLSMRTEQYGETFMRIVLDSLNK